jgi:hypothetical protein
MEDISLPVLQLKQLRDYYTGLIESYMYIFQSYWAFTRLSVQYIIIKKVLYFLN